MPIKRKKRMEMMLPTSSMGDIAFLLIIFFILSSNFMKTANVDMENPTSAEIDKIDDAQVTVAMDKDGKLYVQGVEISTSELESAVVQAIGEHRENPIHLKIDKHLLRSQFMPVMEGLGSAGVKVILVGDKE